jgi:hypothetical protein
MNCFLGFCLLLLIGSIKNSYAQFFLGGGLSVKTTSESINKDSEIEDSDKSFSITYNPKARYFIPDNSGFKGALRNNCSKTTSPSENERKSYNWDDAPFSRFYFTQKGNFSYFREGSHGVGLGKVPKYYDDSGDSYYYEEKSFDINIRISPVFSYNFPIKML